ncbi:type II toxin-antitoxin system RelB/DinJ family antitoxin [Rosenbergiella collisarenosi]|uniref:type II toxin-antitoxin system RelB/DinJ family antitoxin n=1 Tax=Rosenbergiella collisarenosi TaxID=1544695 RepID=UPI001F4EF094|nr:type II toxin-antitoxin system RelB/DinJ family antitoxin [Rosenbergiella collisarenosi]
MPSKHHDSDREETVPTRRGAKKSTMISVRIDETLKKNVEAVLEDLGMTPTEAVTALYRFLAEHKRMPIQSKIITMDSAMMLSESDIKAMKEIGLDTILANSVPGLKLPIGTKNKP